MKAITILAFTSLFSTVFLLHGAFYEQQEFGVKPNLTNSDNPEGNYSSCQYTFHNMTQAVEDTEKSQSYYDYQKSGCLDKRLDTTPGTGEDALLNARRGNPYYDHCCYIRFQKEGTLYHGCIGLKEAEYLDLGDTIDKIENGREPRYFGISDSKVYQFECKSFYPYIKAGLIALLALFY